MENKKKVIHIIIALAILILASSCLFLTGENLISLVKMDEKITFSGSVFMIFFSFPFLSYLMILVVFINITGRYPKHHEIYIRYSAVIAFSSIFLSFPISFYVNYKLKSDNYLVCPRISWMSPNTYVKDMKLCD
ncbi:MULTISPECIES: DUF1240 domain-containing protein [Photorhabdus]|uniref:DUF1240 domain-containing protein n=1 Tax=Photorhabdus bodei TaxID=2029681 RepID=A0AAW6BI24_9GAMM|nr:MULTISPECIES: DUF1240 domain-containing protein [Photorhabdus]MCC8463654.1 DUF1240 domain-containing protein [Photorhabdus bodei]MDB6372216.1 DUF1240 domain-containing protein [Photorhabdus bodei]